MSHIYIATRIVETDGVDENTVIVGVSHDIDRLKKECAGWSGKRRLTWDNNIDDEVFANTGNTYFYITQYQVLS